MTDQELTVIKADIKAEVLKEITGAGYQTSGTKMGVYDEVRNRYQKPLYETFGVYHYDQVWQLIRRLSCYMSGVKYVRDLSPSREFKAAEIAETLCKMAIEKKEEENK